MCVSRLSQLGSLTVAIATLLIGGCQWAEIVEPHNRIVADVQGRMGNSQKIAVDLEDGVSEDEAITSALANNAAYNELLSDLGISAAQLYDAGLIADPQFTIFLPLGPKQLEFTTFQAIDFLWIQPVRVRAAELDLDRVSQSMVQNGLDVIRDARVAHADFVLATQRAKVAAEAAELRQQIADLAQKRLDAGDISELEATTSRIDAKQAQATADRAVHDVTLARERLRVVMGLAMSDIELSAVVGHVPVVERDATQAGGVSHAKQLVAEALTMRPDLRAAEIGIEAACERVGLAKNQFMNLDAVFDANGSGRRGFESGPGARMTLPLFNRNQGGIAIADAQWKQAARRYVTVRDRIVLEVRTAHTRLEQARENLLAIRERILPDLKSAEELARRNYENGGAAYFLVLQTTGQYLDARDQELQLAADVNRALAELERAVGRRLVSSSKADAADSVPPAPAVVASDSEDAVDATSRRIKPARFTAHVTIPTESKNLRTPPSSALPLLSRSSSRTKRRTHVSKQRGEPGSAEKSTKSKQSKRRKRPRGQDAKHVEFTINVQLDPRLKSSGLRVSKDCGEEDSTGED